MGKILDFDAFINEKLNIQPITKERLNGVHTPKYLLNDCDVCIFAEKDTKFWKTFVYVGNKHLEEFAANYKKIFYGLKKNKGGVMIRYIRSHHDWDEFEYIYTSDLDSQLENSKFTLICISRSKSAPNPMDNLFMSYLKNICSGDKVYTEQLKCKNVWFNEAKVKKMLNISESITEKLNITPLSKERIKKMQADIDLMKYMQKNQVELEAKINNDMLQVFNSRVYSLDNAMFSTLSFGNGINCGSKYNMYFTVSLQERECIVGQDIKKPFLDRTLNPISPTAEQRKRMADTGIDYYRKQTGERHLANFETERIYTYYLKFSDLYIEKMVEYLKTKLSDYMDNGEYIVECVDDNGMNAYIAAKFNPKDRTFDKHLNAFTENVILAVNNYVTGTFNKIFA
jgi:hypothetical protein